MNKKVALITGITGMVGSHLAEYIFEHTNWNVHGMIRWRSPLNNLKSIIQNKRHFKRLTFHYGDLRDTISINNVVKTSKPDIVFHLAAQSFPKTSFDSPLETYDTNIQGTTRLLEALKNYAPESIIHVCSSSEVYGRVPKEKIPIDEKCTFHPASPYAISKAGTDLVGRFYFEAYKMNTLITRMFTHTGPRRGDVFAESTFAKQIAMIEKNLLPPVVKVGNLESLRTIADVRDAVRAYYLLVSQNPQMGEAYNIGGTHTCNVKTILEYLISLSTKNGITYEVDSSRVRPIDADLQVPNTNKFSDHTMWKPEITFEKTMLDLLNFWRAEIETNPYSFIQR